MCCFYIRVVVKGCRRIFTKTAKMLLKAYDIPVCDTCVVHSVEEAVQAATEMGYPVLVKASAGGGGKGMRVVRAEDELMPAVEAGRREAKSAFGDDTVYIEKLLERPRT